MLILPDVVRTAHPSVDLIQNTLDKILMIGLLPQFVHQSRGDKMMTFGVESLTTYRVCTRNC